MAITGDSGQLTTPGLNLNVNDYNSAVGKVQGTTVSSKGEYGSLDGWGGEYRNKDYDAGTINGTYVLKGKAGITPDFYQKFSDAFDTYKNTITKDLNALETNPTIGQAFKGTEIEKSIKNLIIAVKQEANDYLFKLEQREKTVIESVKRAFERQQSQMGSSMQADTNKLKNGNSTTADINAFNNKADGWYEAKNNGGGANTGAATRTNYTR